MHELLIDIGTSYIKYACVNTESDSCVYEGRMACPQAGRPGPFRDEIDAMALLNRVTSIVHSCAQQWGELSSIRMSTQMHSFLLTRANGTPLTPLITWRDRRPLEAGCRGSVYDVVRSAEGPGTNVGQTLRANLPVVKVLHLQNEAPALFAEGPVLMQTLGSFINFHMTGEHFTHVTNAATLGLYDVLAGSWNTEPIAGIALPELVLPRVHNDYNAYVRAPESGVLSYPDVGDQQAAYSACTRDAESFPLMLSAGTAGLLSVASERHDPSPGAEARPYFGGLFLSTVTGLPGGDALDGRSAKEFEAAVVKVVGSGRAVPELWVTGGAGPRHPRLWDAVADKLNIERVRLVKRDASLLGLRRLAGQGVMATKGVPE